MEIHNIMRKGIPLLILLILPIIAFAVKPAGKIVNEKDHYGEVNSERIDVKGKHFFLKFKKKVKQFKSKVKQFSDRSKKVKKPVANLLFSSVFLFFSGLTILLVVQNAIAVLIVLGFLALISASILSIMAFRRKKEKNFLVDVWFYGVGIPLLILIGISLGSLVFGLLFF